VGALSALRRFADEVRRPAFLFERCWRVLAWRRYAGLYRRMLEAGELLSVPSSPPANVAFSVIMPVHRVLPEHLEAAVASVLGQTVPPLELVLVDDGAPDPAVTAALERLAADPRIRTVRLPENRGIAAASDAGVRVARGDWLVFVDHDDRLHPRALEIAARTLAEVPDAGWLFTDEDTIDSEGRHGRPVLKPGFSRHLLLGFNLVAHARILRRDLFEALGGHGRGLDGAQDWDLALRALAAGARFVHLPGVLYHWRRVPGSMARGAGEKPAARRAAVTALRRFLTGVEGVSEVTVRPALAHASLFDARWRPDASIGMSLLGSPGTGGPRVRERIPLDSWSAEAIVRAAGRAGEPFVLVAPGRDVPPEAVERLLARVLVPGTAVVAARGVDGGRVTASGWWAVEGGGIRDPWAGLWRGAAGAFNLALLPGPRLMPPPTAWVARRDALLEGWEAVGSVPMPWRLGSVPMAWRLAAGLDRLGLETVTVPGADVASGVPVPPAPAPASCSWREARWWRELGFSKGSDAP